MFFLHCIQNLPVRFGKIFTLILTWARRNCSEPFRRAISTWFMTFFDCLQILEVGGRPGCNKLNRNTCKCACIKWVAQRAGEMRPESCTRTRSMQGGLSKLRCLVRRCLALRHFLILCLTRMRALNLIFQPCSIKTHLIYLKMLHCQ